MPRLDVEDAEYSPHAMSRAGSRTGKGKGKKRLSDGGEDEEESAALLGGRGDGFGGIEPVRLIMFPAITD